MKAQCTEEYTSIDDILRYILHFDLWNHLSYLLIGYENKENVVFQDKQVLHEWTEVSKKHVGTPCMAITLFNKSCEIPFKAESFLLFFICVFSAVFEVLFSAMWISFFPELNSFSSVPFITVFSAFSTCEKWNV